MSRQPVSRRPTPIRSLAVALAVTAAAVACGAAGGQIQPKIIQPGAPGEPSREISAEKASDLAGIVVTDADVKFMQGMISHHAQALDMTELLATRTESEDMRLLAQRIELSQRDEIKMMQDWLRRNDAEVTTIDAHHHMHGDELMPGMLTEAEMQELAAAHGGEFDRLFLQRMVAHHQGALDMVEKLLDTPGAAQESTIFGFTTDVTADQSAEIDRMTAMLIGLSNDPRVALDAGFRDAGQAIWNMELVQALPKPVGFFSPETPAGMEVPPERPDKNGEDQVKKPAAGATDKKEADKAEDAKAKNAPSRGAPILNFANSDMAFENDVVFEGNFHGFNFYSVEDPLQPRLLTSVVCPGGQGDLSVVGNLLIMSVEQTRGRLDCGLQGVADPVSKERFRGIRIFDISDLSRPRQVAAVQTCRGSHTHTVVTDRDDAGNVYVYGSGTSKVRPGEELAGCTDAPPSEDENTALFSIDVIQVPLSHPQDAHIVNRPRIFADPETGAIAGLWKGGRHGRGTQKTAQTNQCHDITVFADKGLAAGACSGNGILLDISDPVHPVRLDQVTDSRFAYWHSATFNNDGTKVVFTDEWGGGVRPRCRASDPRNWGADAIFDIVDNRLKFRSYYKMPAPQTERENCVAHNGSFVPVPGRDIMVQAWYQGGVSMFDFTDSSNPKEIAFFDRGPLDAEKLILGGYWSAYYYDGFIYGTEIARGLDVFKLLPSEYLTQNELDAAALVRPDEYNVQHQRHISWPAKPVVARAYLDQLGRSKAFAPERAEALNTLLDRADSLLVRKTSDRGKTAGELVAFAGQIDADDAELASADRARLASLKETLQGIADQLR